MCPVFAEFLTVFSESLDATPDRFTPKAAFHALYFLRNKLHLYNHFIDTVKVAKELSEEELVCQRAFEKFVTVLTKKVQDSKLGPTFQVSCDTVHQLVHPSYVQDITDSNCDKEGIDVEDNRNINITTINPELIHQVKSAAYKCFRIDDKVLSVIREQVQKQLSLVENEELYSSHTEPDRIATTTIYNRIRKLQAVWRLPHTDLPHSCVIVNKDMHFKYHDITIDPSIIMLKQQIIVLLWGGIQQGRIEVDLDRICLMIYDILELRRFYGRDEDMQEYIAINLQKDIKEIIYDCKQLRSKYLRQEHDHNLGLIFENMLKYDEGIHADDIDSNFTKIVSLQDLRNILGDPVEREEPKFYMRGLFLR